MIASVTLAMAVLTRIMIPMPAKVIAWLDDFYVGTYDDDMSRADYWALAAIAAVKATAISANGEDCTYGE